jgi:hypothetical protein
MENSDLPLKLDLRGDWTRIVAILPPDYKPLGTLHIGNEPFVLAEEIFSRGYVRIGRGGTKPLTPAQSSFVRKGLAARNEPR